MFSFKQPVFEPGVLTVGPGCRSMLPHAWHFRFGHRGACRGCIGIWTRSSPPLAAARGNQPLHLYGWFARVAGSLSCAVGASVRFVRGGGNLLSARRSACAIGAYSC